MAEGRFVSYLRAFTARQGRSSLGLEAQRETVRLHLNGRDWQLVDEFVEVESGNVTDRPNLLEALRLCRVRDATLVIAKLDRPSRDAHFLLGLGEGSVDFFVADMPEMDEFTAHIFAAMAQRERKLISSRTRDGLAALKQRGVTKKGSPVRLGNPKNSTEEQTARANAGAKREADAYAERAAGEIRK